MKRLSILFIAFTVCILQACSHSGNVNDKDSDSITSADSANALSDTNKKVAVAQSAEDIQFASEAASGGLTEVALGKLALKNGVNKRVKNFGAMMVKDHSKANIKLMALAKTKNITLPTVPNDKDQKIIDKLSKKWGEDFDKAYVDDMIADHNDDIKVFEDASKNSSDPDIKNFAAKTLPVLKNHLEAINTIQSSMH